MSMWSKFWRDAGTLLYIVPVTESFSSIDDVPDYIGNAIPFFLLLVFFEVLYGKLRRHNLYCLKDTIMSLSLGVVQVILGIWLKEVVFIPYSLLYDYCTPLRTKIVAQYFPSLLSLTPQQYAYATFAVGFFGVDLGYYLFHRFAHEWHALWASHSVHHSGERYNFATALRQGALQQVGSWVFYLPLAVLGLPLAQFSRHSRLNTVYQFWIHTEIIGRLPWFLELVMNTASHHRLHHKPPGNCNYAGVLIIWDRLFGTFQPECGWPTDKENIPRGVIYGLAKPLGTYDPVYANMQHSFRMAESNNHQNASWDAKFLQYLNMSSKRRVTHPWRVVTTWEEFAPDIIHDWHDGRSWIERLFELPPNVEKDGDKLVKRERDFIAGRNQREGHLSESAWYTVAVQFLLSMVGALAVILNNHLAASSESKETRTTFAVTCTLCVLALQTFKLYY